MKKILILGGTAIQTPAIVRARASNFHVITCSYNANDPGHSFSDEYHNIDITRADKVLELAKHLKVDMIWAYASEVAAPVAAYVNEKMGLQGNPYDTIRTLTEKDRFKQFLEKNNFKTPKSYSVSETKTEIEIGPALNYPVVVKAVDSSGCKGSRLVKSAANLNSAVDYALSFSRKKRAIIEEYIYKQGPEVTGDGFVIDGELVFLHLGDHHFDFEVNKLLAYATTWPSVVPDDRLNMIKGEVKRAIKEVGYRFGPINVDARIGIDGNVYILEIAPRNGGNYIPQLMKRATGFDTIDASLKLMAGEDVEIKTTNSACVALYLLHSNKKGAYFDVGFSPFIQNFIIEKKIFINEGDSVGIFKDISKAIGVLFMEFSNPGEMSELIPKVKNHFDINLLAGVLDGNA